MTLTTKTQIQTLPIFLIESTRISASIEGFKSSPAQSAGELWPSAKIAKVTFCGTWFFTKSWVIGP